MSIFPIVNDFQHKTLINQFKENFDLIKSYEALQKIKSNPLSIENILTAYYYSRALESRYVSGTNIELFSLIRDLKYYYYECVFEIEYYSPDINEDLAELYSKKPRMIDMLLDVYEDKLTESMFSEYYDIFIRVSQSQAQRDRAKSKYEKFSR